MMDLLTNDTSRNMTCCLASQVSPISDLVCVCNGTDNDTGPNPGGGPHADSPAMGPPLYMYVYVTLLNVVVFLVGVLGNVLVIQVVARTKSMRRRMNYFLVSLSIADLQLLVVGLPIALMEFYSKDRWYLGGFMCRAESFLENNSHHCSVLTLLAIGFERYYAICHPLRETVGSRFTSPNILIPVVWILSCVGSLPFAIMSSTREEEFYDNSKADVCFTDMNSTLARVYIFVIFAVFLALPLILLTIMYTAIIMTLAGTTMGSSGGGHSSAAGTDSNNGSMSSINHPSRNVHRVDSEHFKNSRAIQSRRQVVRMMVAVMALYFICLVPLRCFQLWVTFGTTQQVQNLGFESYLNLVYSLRLLMYVNSAGNPIIYGLLSTNFRSAFRKSISCYSNRMDGYRYNTAYYNSSHHHRSYAPSGHTENSTIRNSQFPFASPKHRADSHNNLSSGINTEQMLPLAESVSETETRALRVSSGQDSEFYSPRDVVGNPSYRSLKTEVYLKNHKNGNVYV